MYKLEAHLPSQIRWTEGTHLRRAPQQALQAVAKAQMAQVGGDQDRLLPQLQHNWRQCVK